MTSQKTGTKLVEGCWYLITEIDPNDPNPSLKVGDEVLCATNKPGCIDPENHEKDGMGTQWFADYDAEDGSFRTLVTGVELVRNPPLRHMDGCCE